MINNTGKIKKHRKKFQHLRKNGARVHRQDFIESNYIHGIVNVNGEQVIRPLNIEERQFLDDYYKEFVHGTFVTDKESTKLFKIAKKLSKKPDNVKFFEDNGFYPEEVERAVNSFNEKSKRLGNMACDFWQQRDINSDDYKRRFDIQNNASKGLQLESFEDIQYISNVDDFVDTIIEDLITESEE